MPSEFQAVNCRIPKKTFEAMQKLQDNTNKSTAAFVKDAIDFYLKSVEEDLDSDFKPLKIDQYAYKLHQEK